MGHILVLGGARSGKTAFAETRALALGRAPAYIATAEAWDDEMRARIARHRDLRANRFTTIDAPLDLAPAIAIASAQHDTILVDCLTLWITNLMLAGRDINAAVTDLLATLAATATPVILVSNEVGLGIVPDNAMARQFRDHAGLTHQRLATLCTEVHFIVAGLPMTLKG